MCFAQKIDNLIKITSVISVSVFLLFCYFKSIDEKRRNDRSCIIKTSSGEGYSVICAYEGYARDCDIVEGKLKCSLRKLTPVRF